jgi:peroxiredoxin Q/BCP
MSILEIGQIAPNFEALVQYNDKSENINLYSLLESGQKVLLVFYPSDGTPGCTAQLCGIRDIYKEYIDLGVTVFGVNPANEASHQKFINQHAYPFGIVVDSDKTIRENYGAVGKFWANIITKRSVFLINTDKKIIFSHSGQQNNQEILELLKK